LGAAISFTSPQQAAADRDHLSVKPYAGELQHAIIIIIKLSNQAIASTLQHAMITWGISHVLLAAASVLQHFHTTLHNPPWACTACGTAA
jgi:hypothetical protein